MDFEQFQEDLGKQTTATQAVTKSDQEIAFSVAQTNAVIKAITAATKALLDFQKDHKPQIEVQLPDFKDVISALNDLKKPIKSNKPDYSKITAALEKINQGISKLPTEAPESVTVLNQLDYKEDFQTLNESIKSIDVKPIIKPQKSLDLTFIANSLSDIVSAVEDIKFPEIPEIDLSGVIQATESLQGSIENLKFPVPNYVLPFKDSSNKATQVQLNSDGSLPFGGTVTAAVTNDGTFAKETGGNLATIAGKDFATQTTLALIKAKTDNLDVALSTRLKPSDTLTKVTTVDTITNSVSTLEGTGLVPKVYDYIAANFSGSTADVYTYKVGGSSGTTAATLTVNWTDSTKTVLASVVRT